ncbi:MAG: 8-amino-7-oxononanoate synthase [Gammaproteobacteria bacterium]|nr:8-amino-7-oxononanoate synthase [Gammaproteobacteria bacterium]
MSKHEHGFRDLEARLDVLRTRQLFRTRRIVESPQGREIVVDGRSLLNFSSNDYLGLASDPRIAEAFQEGIRTWGSGSGASHLISGHTAAHHALEEELADFVERPRALLFGSGYAANVGVINALLSIGDQVFEDRLNHASLLDGGWISRADFQWFEHRDMDQLRCLVERGADRLGRRLIVSDGIFSMDGDQCRLDELIAIAQRTESWLQIDDAHGIGVYGPHGKGTVDPARYATQDVPVLIGTLGKAFGTAGAFVAGEEALIETLVQRSRNYIFTTAMPAALACATSRSLKIVQQESWRRSRLTSLVRRFQKGVQSLELPVPSSCSPIQPLVLGGTEMTLSVARSLEEQGCFVVPIRPPTVPVDTSRLRITFTAAHSEADVDRLVDALNAAYTE